VDEKNWNSPQSFEDAIILLLNSKPDIGPKAVLEELRGIFGGMQISIYFQGDNLDPGRS